MSNILVNVATFNRGGLAFLYNSNPEIQLANKMFNELNKIPKNLGDTVTFDLPPFVEGTPTLAFGTFKSVKQVQQPLTVDIPYTVPIGVTNEEKIFNLEEYMGVLAKSSIANAGSYLAKKVAQNNIDHTFLTYGDGTEAGLSSYPQLMQAVANFKNMGVPITDEICGIVPDTDVPRIIGTGANMFIMDKNNEAFNSWELGTFGRVKWYTSNCLPEQIAGTVGEDGIELTVTSISGDGSQITFSGAPASDADAINVGDILTINDNILRFTDYWGIITSRQKVQVRVTDNNGGSSGGGSITVDVFPPLIATGLGKNINIPVAAGMKATSKKSHRAGLLFCKRALFLAMPSLGSTSPYEGKTETDPESGISLRTFYGFLPQDGSYGYAHQFIAGTTLADRWSMRLAFPL